MDNKQKYAVHCLTLAERIAVIRAHDQNRNITSLAEEFQCGKTQIRNILHRREGYLEEWKNNGDPNSMRLRKSHRNLSIQLVVHEWIQRSKSYPDPIDDLVIQSMGMQVARRLGVLEHRPSKRWLERFKRKFRLDRPGALDTGLSDGFIMKSLNLDDIIEDVMPQLEQEKNKKREKYFGSDILKPIDTVDISESDSNSDFHGSSHMTDSNSFYPEVEVHEVKPIESYKEALNCLGPLEQFALMQENIRVIGLINQIENIFRDEIAKGT